MTWQMRPVVVTPTNWADLFEAWALLCHTPDYWSCVDDSLVDSKYSSCARAYAGGVGVKTPLEFAMLQKRHYLCKGFCVCFRTVFACL